MANLNETQFPTLYHGTSHLLEGGEVKPATPGKNSTEGDMNARYGQSKFDVASATSDESTAWKFAAIAAAERTRLGKDAYPAVHKVEAHPETRLGVEHLDHPVNQQAWDEDWYRKPENHEEYVAPSFKVQETYTARKGQDQPIYGEAWGKYGTPSPAPETNKPMRFRRNPSGESLAAQKKRGREMYEAAQADYVTGQGRLF